MSLGAFFKFGLLRVYDIQLSAKGALNLKEGM